MWRLRGILGTFGMFLCAVCVQAEQAPLQGKKATPPAVRAERDSRWPLLMVDTSQIAENKGVGLTVCEAVRHPDNPVIRLGQAGSPGSLRCDFDGSVYYVDGKFRVWYHAAPGGNAYAESSDGSHSAASSPARRPRSSGQPADLRRLLPRAADG